MLERPENGGPEAKKHTKTPILCSAEHGTARSSSEEHGTSKERPRRGREQPPETEQDRLERSATARSTTKRNRHATQRNRSVTHNATATATPRNRHATAQWGTTKKETTFRVVSFKNWRLPTLPHGSAVPSAQVSLTSLFGMGRGGSSPLLPP